MEAKDNEIEKEGRRKYMRDYHHDYCKKKWHCNICDKEMTNSNKYKHVKSVKHIKNNDEIKNTVGDILKSKGFNIKDIVINITRS